MEEISQFVSNVGFPIVACIFMYFNQKELNKTISELSSTLKGIDTRLDILEKDKKWEVKKWNILLIMDMVAKILGQ